MYTLIDDKLTSIFLKITVKKWKYADKDKKENNDNQKTSTKPLRKVRQQEMDELKQILKIETSKRRIGTTKSTSKKENQKQQY